VDLVKYTASDEIWIGTAVKLVVIAEKESTEYDSAYVERRSIAAEILFEAELGSDLYPNKSEAADVIFAVLPNVEEAMTLPILLLIEVQLISFELEALFAR
jgi:hypothetical protein